MVTIRFIDIIYNIFYAQSYAVSISASFIEIGQAVLELLEDIHTDRQTKMVELG